MVLGVVGSLVITLLQIYFWIYSSEEFKKNRSIISKYMDKKLRGSFLDSHYTIDTLVEQK